MSGRRYHMLEVVGEPLLVPVLIADEGPQSPNPSLPHKGGPVPDLTANVPLCPQCRQPIVTPVSRVIIGRDRHPVTRKAIVTRTTIVFCSDQCGLHCQYAHEG